MINVILIPRSLRNMGVASHGVIIAQSGSPVSLDGQLPRRRNSDLKSGEIDLISFG